MIDRSVVTSTFAYIHLHPDCNINKDMETNNIPTPRGRDPFHDPRATCHRETVCGVSEVRGQGSCPHNELCNALKMN